MKKKILLTLVLTIPIFILAFLFGMERTPFSIQAIKPMETTKPAEQKKAQVPAEEIKIEDNRSVVTPSPESNSLYLVGIGDSLTEGVGDPLKEGYIGITKDELERKYNINVAMDNYAKKGLRSDQLLKKLKKQEITHALADADMIFMTIGGNDMMQVFQKHFFHLNVDLFEKQSETFADNLREIMTIIRAENAEAPIFVIGLFNPYMVYFSEIVEINKVIQIWNQKTEAVLDEYSQSYFVPTDFLFSDDEELLLHEDYFHPNRQGYELMAEELMNSIENELHFVP